MIAETVNLIAPILQTGAVGAMLLLTWRLMTKKDKKSYEMIEAQNQERREMYHSMEELVREVTVALTYKNVTDDKMAAAIEKLSEQFRDLREALKEKQ